MKKIGQFAWAAGALARYGVPRRLVYHGLALGDQLLCTAVFRELRKRGQHGFWTMSNHPELFVNNGDVEKVLPFDPRYAALARRFGREVALPYVHHLVDEDRDIPPQHHIITSMCQLAGMTGRVSLRPYLWLTDEEKQKGRLVTRQVAIQTSGLAAPCAMQNKEWYPDRFQAVASALAANHNLVQVGSVNDPPLEGVLDLRGKTTVRETAAVLNQSLVFVGLVGFLMHLARAVECRSVIIYGGREIPQLTGYSSNSNLFTILPCSPCWYWNTCDYSHECMKRIDAAMVLEAVKTQLEKHREPIAVDTDDIRAG